MSDAVIAKGDGDAARWHKALPALATLGALAAIVAAAMTGVIARGNLIYDIFIDPVVAIVSLPDLFVQTVWEGFVAGVLYA